MPIFAIPAGMTAVEALGLTTAIGGLIGVGAADTIETKNAMAAAAAAAAARAKDKANAKAKVDVTVCLGCNEDENPCKKFACGKDGSEFLGGAHWCMTEKATAHIQSHHAPARIATALAFPGLSEDDGPAIQMEEFDHIETASYGARPGDSPYIQEQMRLIGQGDYYGAVNLDNADVRSKFKGKYDQAFGQLYKYLDCLRATGKILQTK